ncbi:MAG TPA: hypothetical protein VIF37_02430 [Methylobacter sp.]|jgi:hypothetical protein
MILGVSALGTECIGGGSLDEVIIEAIKKSIDIPSVAKEAIQDTLLNHKPKIAKNHKIL